MPDLSSTDNDVGGPYRYGPRTFKYGEGYQRKPGSGGSRRLYTWVPDEHYDAVIKAAQSEGISPSRLQRRIIASHFGIEDPDA